MKTIKWLVLLAALFTVKLQAQVRELELLVVMDGEFTQRIAPVTPQAWIENFVNEANVWWERDLAIRIKLVRLDAFFDSASDPFVASGSNVQGMLDEIKAYGNAQTLQKDATHFFTGKSMQYGGYTYVGVTCTWPTFSYGWSQLGFWGYTWTHSAFSVELSHQLSPKAYYDDVPSCDGALLGKNVQLVDFHDNWFCAETKADIDARLASAPACLAEVDGGGGGTGDTQPPSVSITSPSGSRVSPGSNLSIAANASDNVGVTRVEFSVNGTLFCTEVESPYTCGGPTTVKGQSYQIVARAFDAVGNNTATSKTVRAQGGGNKED